MRNSKILKISLVVAVASLMFVAGYAQGQNTSEKQLGSKLFDAETKAILSFSDEKGQGEAVSELLNLYRDAATNPNMSRAIAGRSLYRYTQGQTGTGSQYAEEASFRLQLLQTEQNQKLIEQNVQIIQLLKQQKGK